jgi:CO dehydrogenase/acetyl-CoA synthase epsilon subunit
LCGVMTVDRSKPYRRLTFYEKVPMDRFKEELRAICDRHGVFLRAEKNELVIRGGMARHDWLECVERWEEKTIEVQCTADEAEAYENAAGLGKKAIKRLDRKLADRHGLRQRLTAPGDRIIWQAK